MKRIVDFLYNLTVIVVIAAVVAHYFNPGISMMIAVAFFIYQFIPGVKTPIGCARNEVIRKIFSSDLQEKLFPANAFYKGALVDTGVADTAESVDVPQDEDGEAESIENPKKFPLETVSEEDKKKSYSVHLIATKPQLVTDLNQAIVTYDKRGAKLRKHSNTLNNRIANRINYEWSPTKADFIRYTTGTTNRAGHAPGATGDRKRVAKEDIFWGFSLFNDLDIPVNGDGMGERRLLIPAYMYEDLLTIPEFIDLQKLKARGDLSQGQIGEILGFKVYMRSKTQVFDNSGTPAKKAIGAAAANTDNQSALFFHTAFVRYAEGQSKLYVNLDKGEYLGGTMNAKVRCGAMISRLSEIGVAALVEKNV